MRMVLTVPPSIERQFKRAARKAWPRETWAFLIGTIAGDHAYVDELFFPEDVDAYCTEGSVHIQDRWFVDAAEQAKESEAVILGAGHSHPYRKGFNCLRDRAHSEADMDTSLAKMISGVCVVQEMKDGRLRASMRWWGPSVELRVERGD
ncbi:MAG TPA: Mov34/MPN/PAD-1 family protein [Bryobacteraceae bacterium]|nr:Mov34/MPN/PAD-1 family protein [Bryobacteraceae bacterium]